MSFTNLNLTKEGKSAILRAMGGSTITFTRVALGNGEAPEDIFNVEDMSNVVCYGTITDYSRETDKALLKWMLNSETIENEFKWTEYGLMATLDDSEEFLFAYSYDKSDYPQPIGNALANISVEINITVGDVENVTANVSEYSAYASKEAFDNHCKSKNPHNITKEDLGLGNVENSKVEDVCVAYTEKAELENLVSGDSVKTIFSKLKTVVKSYIKHLSSKNPHKLTASDISAANSTHNHSTNDINSGTLSVARGGTGASNSANALDSLVTGNDITLSNGKFIKGKLSNKDVVDVVGTYANNIIVGRNASDDSNMYIYAGNEVQINTNIKGGLDQKGWTFDRTGCFAPFFNNAGFKIGTSNAPIYDIYSVNGITTVSDRKIKENITDCEIGLELIRKLNFKEFNFVGSDRRICGLVAQDVFDVVQELGIENSNLYKAFLIDDPEHKPLSDEEIKNTDDSLISWGVNYEQVTNYILSAAKNMESRISAIERRLKM